MKNRTAPTNRRFGIFMASIFALLSARAAYQEADEILAYAFLVACVLVGLFSIAAPSVLAPFNRAWMQLGDLMGKVVSPLVLGTIFFVLITPISLIARLFGRDELRLKRTTTNSYWINRTPAGPAGDSFKNQF